MQYFLVFCGDMVVVVVMYHPESSGEELSVLDPSDPLLSSWSLSTPELSCCSGRHFLQGWNPPSIKFLALPNALDSFTRLNHWALSRTIPFDWSFSPPFDPSHTLSFPLFSAFRPFVVLFWSGHSGHTILPTMAMWTTELRGLTTKD